VAVLEQAAKQIGVHDLAGAESALRQLLEQSPDDPLALNLLGFVRFEQQRPAEAEKLYRRAIEEGPHLAGPHMNLALLYGAGRAEDAIGELSEALRIAPDHDQAQRLLGEIARQASAAAARSGDKDRALALLLAAHKVLPRDPDLLVDTALAAMEKGLFADGRCYLVEALEIRLDYPRATYALARAYLGESKNQLAEEQMRQYLALRPGDASAQFGLGLILIGEQKVDEARAAFEKSLALEPRQTESHFQLGEIALEQSANDRAREQFEQVLKSERAHAGALTGLGILAYREGRLPEALDRLEQAVRLAPDYYKAHYFYSLVLRKQGRRGDADREFRIATDLQKHDTPTARLAPDRQ
jgi:tetratricopeptide (TPR) repeat protein